MHRVLVVDLVARPVRRLEKRSLPSIQLQIQCLDCDIQMVSLRGTDDGHVAIGIASDPCHGHVRGAHASTRRNLAHTAGDFAIDLVAIKTLVEIMCGTGGALCFAPEETTSE